MSDLPHEMNALGQPIGLPVSLDLPRPRPPVTAMVGRTVTVRPLEMSDADALHTAFREDLENRIWTYLPNGPYETVGDFRAWAADAIATPDPMMHAILVDGEPLGHASFLRIKPDPGTIEVGFINFAPRLQRTVAATECMYLMMARAFDELGYRRYEWKCDALNAPSRSAAKRLGFTFEGVFRQATVYKGRNRDTAWFSVTDAEWPGVKAGFEAWLDPGNFDENGRQRRSLIDLRATHAAPRQT